MDDRIRTGIIGFGLSGEVFHAPFVHTHPGFELFAVVERRRQRSKDIYPYVNVVRDYQDLLKDDALELIVIATPNAYHYQMASECLMAGKHVVIEKPFTPSSAEADRLIRLSDDTGRKIFVYHNRRWDGDFLTIRKLLDEQALGEISFYEAHFDRYKPEVKADAWREEDMPGGGILYDLGSHLIDQALVLFGMPQTLLAQIGSERKGSKVDDSFKLELNYPSTRVVLRAGMMVKTLKPRYTIKGSMGLFTKPGIDPQESRLKAGEMPVSAALGSEAPQYWGTLEKTGDAGREIRRVPAENGYYMGFYEEVYSSVRQNKVFPVLPVQARDVIFIIEKAFESSRNNQLIKIKN